MSDNTKTTVDHCFGVSPNGVAIQMTDGSIFYVYGLGQRCVSVSFAPDGWHYPEPLEANGRLAEGTVFTCHTPESERG